MKNATIVLCLIVLSAGCAATYVTPSPGARLEMLGATAADQAKNTDGTLRVDMDRKPLASFPASVVIARVQVAGYRSYTNSGYGGGNYSVITTRDIESDDQMARLAKLPQVRAIAPLNRLVISPQLQSDYELRAAAAKMRADMVLIYTLDTQFRELDRTTPLSVVTLGATPTKKMRILCTASAILLDTRNGYIYGLAEASKNRDELRNAWKTESEIDTTRRAVESEAFASLVGQVETTWNGIVSEYARPAGASRYETR